ncbi:hypothetical protein HCN44_002277 [Aphidius gifuensis]|uniref:Uncharacterized protein n=1 Tax=Aphidius gifuensis TaxID=684658 RepID=A0A834Y503_APHGI|nr:uncharacterized protein LOC122860664 [Aphidius gifuensis]KAF7996631.1 hypothetical protein HCN44_002277 [Aphidius gifuensis]
MQQETKKIKKKKKAKKGVKMTIEQRVNLLKEKSQRECKMGTINSKILDDFWYEIMTQFKTSDIRKDIRIIKKFIQRGLDIMDFRIIGSIEEWDEAELLYKKNFASHVENIERFEKIYNQRLNAQQEFYNDKMNFLVNEADVDTDKIHSVHSETMNFLQSVVISGDKKIKNSLQNTQSAVITKLDNAREDGQNFNEMALIELERKIFNYQNDFNDVVSKYHNDTRERLVLFERLKKNDTKDQQIMISQSLQIGQLINSINKLKDMIVQLKINIDQKIINISCKKNSTEEIYMEMKECFRQDQEKCKKRLTILTKNFNSTMEYLGGFAKKTRLLIDLIKICQKYEMQSDKILPLGYNQSEKERGFDFFWYRVGLVEHDTINLKKKLNRLKLQSNCLKSQIRYKFENQCREKSFKHPQITNKILMLKYNISK